MSSVAVSWQNVPSVDSMSPELCMPLKYEPLYSIFSILVSRDFIHCVIKYVMTSLFHNDEEWFKEQDINSSTPEERQKATPSPVREYRTFMRHCI